MRKYDKRRTAIQRGNVMESKSKENDRKRVSYDRKIENRMTLLNLTCCMRFDNDTDG